MSIAIKKLINKQSLLTVQKKAGFSLIEILIAMLIISVMVGVAIISLNSSNDKYAKQETERLLIAIENVRDIAVIQNNEYGLSIDDKGYQFLRLNDSQQDDSKKTAPPFWEIVEDNLTLGQYEFPDSIEINIAIDGENIFETEENEVDIFDEDVDIFEDEDEPPKVDPPQIYFLSTGEQNDFVLAIGAKRTNSSVTTENNFYRITGTIAGEIKYEGPLEGNIFTDILTEYEEEEKTHKR